MSKSKKQKSRKNVYIFLGILLAIYLIYSYRASNREVSTSLNSYVQSLTPTPYPTRPVTAPISNLITYVSPYGWKEKEVYTNNENYISFSTQDYKPNLGEGTKTGVLIIINRLKCRKTPCEGPSELIPTSNSVGPVYDVKNFAVDGVEAVSFHLDYEGHSQTVLFIKNGYIWNIGIQSSSLEAENSHRQEIDSLVNSIRFK